MTNKSYRDKNRDLEILLRDIEAWFNQQGYQTQTNKADGNWLLQAAKTDLWRKAVGASRAFNVLIKGFYRTCYAKFNDRNAMPTDF